MGALADLPIGQPKNTLRTLLQAKLTSVIFQMIEARTGDLRAHPFARCVPRDRIAPTVSEIVGAFKAVWGESWGPRMERNLYFALAALIEAGNASLLGLPRLLKDEKYHADILERVKDRQR